MERWAPASASRDDSRDRRGAQRGAYGDSWKTRRSPRGRDRRDSRSPSRRRGGGKGGSKDRRGARQRSRSCSRSRRDDRRGVPSAPSTTILDIVDGVNDMTKRSELKTVFEQFGHVAALYLPPVGYRLASDEERSYVKFGSPTSAQMCKDACDAGQVYSHERRISVVWKTTHFKTTDAHDFDAKGSNLTSSRDMYLKELKDKGKKLPERKRRRSSSSSSSSSSHAPKRSKRREIFGGPGSQASKIPVPPATAPAPQGTFAIQDQQNEEFAQEHGTSDPVQQVQTGGLLHMHLTGSMAREAAPVAKVEVEQPVQPPEQPIKPQACTKCGEMYAADSIFCRKCGERRQDACPNCCTIYAPGSSFCWKCGEHREVCIECGTQYSSEAIFCRKCGQKRLHIP